MSSRKYYARRFRLDGADRYVIWYTNHRDGLVESDGRIASFASIRQLERYARAHGLTLQLREPDLLDWDQVWRWCQRPGADLDPTVFLNAWNALNDARTPDGRGHADAELNLFGAADQRNNAIYDKLFHASLGTGVYRQPGWSPDEVSQLAQVLRLGLAYLRERLTPTS
jgi:hypothetical protein